MDQSAPSPDFLSTDAPVTVAHSILQAQSLGTLVARHWSLGDLQSAELLQHGQNDWYRISAANKPYAIRVLKSGLRTALQLREEMDWSAALADQGIATPRALPCGPAWGLRIAAPEGPRLVCAYPWVEGRTLARDLGVEDARAAGRLLASIHACPAQLPPHARRHSLGDKLARTAAALDAALGDAREIAMVAEVRAGIADTLAREGDLPSGSLHGDLHFGNLRRGPDQALHALDFDDCGRGAYCVDLTPFLWRNRIENLDPSLDAAFLQAYQERRPLNAVETAALPALLAARALYLASVLARDRNILGKVPGFDKPWRLYLDLAADCLRPDRAPRIRG